MQGEEAEEGHEKCTTQVWPEHLQHVLGNIWKHFHCTHSMCLETFGNTSIVRMQKKQQHPITLLTYQVSGVFTAMAGTGAQPKCLCQ